MPPQDQSSTPPSSDTPPVGGNAATGIDPLAPPASASDTSAGEPVNVAINTPPSPASPSPDAVSMASEAPAVANPVRGPAGGPAETPAFGTTPTPTDSVAPVPGPQPPMASSSEPVTATPSVAPLPGHPLEAAAHGPKSGKKGLMIAAIIGALIIVILLAVVVLFGSSSDSSTGSNELLPTNSETAPQ